ncbi:conserved hypothetical protein [Desulfonatronospira thiodismutans ASO3-1]|uniref:Uncharacterized protein n=1 Tax=Desulfonatronospira thiodismutans ASO3-1 TaxID=555779 RepID=D6SRP9_9BACT|nr:MULTISPECIES: hypothetical protein [Desulfonatronospira]EFI33365.1 conserved hypothetical protein [Desulfonatronospira thiodismutans ASO3-1]RQD78851.1 MAG: hypothetical protein D5S03_01305 [Desulfonatronospira sp. MSAO_Bac3]
MGIREKILVTMMVLALAYGAFELFYSPADPVEEKDPEQEVQEAQQFSQSMSQDLQEADITEAQKRILQAAARDWPGEIFHEFPDAELLEEETVQEETDFGPLRYSGYVQMGDQKIAIINAREYSRGEELKDEPARVVEITSEKVLLESLETGQQVPVPYEGD